MFGLRERGTNKFIFYVVEDRSAQTLLPIIIKHVLPGTRVISDMWKAYSSIDQHGFEHSMVNHSLNFVAPESNKKLQVCVCILSHETKLLPHETKLLPHETELWYLLDSYLT